MRYLDKYSAREKELRRLDREMDQLRLIRRKAPVLPLERPYQRGWMKTFVLEPRVERRPDAQIFRNMLLAINRPVYFRNRSFTNKGGPILLRPQKINLGKWRQLAWPASHQRYFRFGTWRIEDDSFWFPPRHGWRCGYKLVHDWWLREEIIPRFITHCKVDLPDVRERIEEIEYHMKCTHGWDHLRRLHGHRQWRFHTTISQERTSEYLDSYLRTTPD